MYFFRAKGGLGKLGLILIHPLDRCKSTQARDLSLASSCLKVLFLVTYRNLNDYVIVSCCTDQGKSNLQSRSKESLVLMFPRKVWPAYKHSGALGVSKPYFD